MAKPSSRQELTNYALRQLGAPVLEINIADEQIDDCLDDTLQMFNERHYDGVVRTYLKYSFTQADIDRGRSLRNVGIDTATSTYPQATGITTAYYHETSNYIQLPDHIIGVERVLTPFEATGSGYIWGGYPNLIGPDGAVPYDTAFTNLYGFGGYDLITYSIAKSWWETVDFLFSPEAGIRFNIRQDRLYLDINWTSIKVGQFILIDCYRALDPEEFNKIYNDRFVKRYFTANLKRQWGQNLIKFRGTRLAGGIELNGREIYDDAVNELNAIKQEMSSSYELPPLDFIG